MKEKICKKGITRRLLSVVLALTMVVALMPSMTVQAAEPVTHDSSCTMVVRNYDGTWGCYGFGTHGGVINKGDIIKSGVRVNVEDIGSDEIWINGNKVDSSTYDGSGITLTEDVIIDKIEGNNIYLKSLSSEDSESTAIPVSELINAEPGTGVDIYTLPSGTVIKNNYSFPVYLDMWEYQSKYYTDIKKDSADIVIAAGETYTLEHDTGVRVSAVYGGDGSKDAPYLANYLMTHGGYADDIPVYAESYIKNNTEKTLQILCWDHDDWGAGAQVNPYIWLLDTSISDYDCQSYVGTFSASIKDAIPCNGTIQVKDFPRLVESINTYEGDSKYFWVGEYGWGAPILPPAPVHYHSYQWNYDDTEHWETCISTEGTCSLQERNRGSHTWDEGTVKTAATCSSKGSKEYTCTECGKTKTEDIDKDATNHSNITKREAKAATCIAEGISATYWECLDCQKYYSNEAGTTEITSETVEGYKIPKRAHTWDTYSAENNILVVSCSTSGCTEKVTLTLTASDANYSGTAYTGAVIKDSSDNLISDTDNNLWIKAGIDAPTVEFKVNDTWGTTAPTEVGTYQVRMYPSGETQTDDNTVVAEFSINKIAIDAVTFTEPTVAATGTPATATELAIDENANYTGAISWSPTEAIFGYNKAYTATVTLTAKDNYEFADEVVALDGWSKDESSTKDSLVLTKTYDNTAKAKITSVTVPSVTTELTALTTKDAQLEALAKEASKVAVTVEDNSVTSMAITWALKADTTYSTVSEAENIFVWTVTETEYANYDTNSKALTGEVTIKNPAHVHEADNDKKTDAFAGNCVEKATAEWYACKDTTCDKKLDKDGNEIENIEGELKPDVHKSSETSYDKTADTHTLKYACCGAVKEEAENHTYGDTDSARYTCTVCSYVDESKKLDIELADAVVEKINDIGTVEYTDESKGKIDDARAAYDALTDAQKELITEEQLKALTDAEAAYAQLKEAAEKAAADKAAADAVVEKIEAIGTVEYTDESKGKIDEARSAYDALTDAQKALVTEDQLKVLTDAETAYAQLKAAAEKAEADKAAADAVIAKIDAIGTPVNAGSEFRINKARAAYNALTDDQKALVSNYEKLEEAEEVYEKIKADTDAKNSVCKLINAIGNVEYTDACKAKIDKARAAYDELNDELKAQISLNYADLEKAEAKYAELKAAADKAAADKVTDKIKAIKEPITLDKEADIKAARTAYDALTADQKELVSVVGMLEDAEDALAARKLNKVSASWTSASQANGKITFVKAEREGKPLTDENKGQEFNYTADSITAMKGDVVTLSLVPNYGYQVSSTWAKANGVVALEKVSEFDIPVNTNLNFKDVFVKASNEVIVNSKYVASANIKNGNNATNTGTLRFKVVDNSDYSKDVTKVVDIEEGQKIEKVASLELDLNSLVGKGAPDINWDNSVKEFDKNINVELKLKNITLEDGATLSVVREHNGTLKQLDSTYDSKTGVLTFATNRFSTYTIVKKVNVKKDIVVSQLRIDPKSVVLTTKGETNTLKVIFNPSNATNKAVTWTSSDTSVVKVDANGKITAVANGTAVITATSKSNPMATSKCNVTVKLSKVSVAYQTHIQTYGDSQGFKKDGEMAGTSGEAKRLESLKVKISGNPNLGIAYTTHVQTYGWLPWSHNGEASGTSGEAKRMEALKIQLKGADASKYDVYYRVHAQTYGWLNWAKNGEAAGTAGLAKRLEGIQIVVVEKGKTFNQNMGNIKSTNAKAFIQGTSATTEPVKYDEPTPNVMYKTHVQTFGWQNWKTNGAMSGTSGLAKRLEGINIKLTNAPYAGGIRYMTHVQTFGWEKAWRADGAMSGTSGLAKRLEGIRIELTGEMAKHYDVYYRVHAQTFGWLGWAKNGESAGTEGLAKRLEGIQIILVKKGDKAPAANYGGITSKTSKPFIKK